MADYLTCRRDGHDYGAGAGVSLELAIGETQTCRVCECSRERTADGGIVYHSNDFGKSYSEMPTVETEVLPNGATMTVIKGAPGQTLSDILKANAGIDKMESVYGMVLPEYEGRESECVFHVTRLKDGKVRLEFGADNDDIPRLMFRDGEVMKELARTILEVFGD